MTTPLREALELLLVGMTTVALVLGLVVLAGRLLIYAINRTEPAAVKKGRLPAAGETIDPAIIAVLTATVDHVTQGRGTIQKIDPL